MRILTLVLSLLIFNLNIQDQSKEEPKNNLNNISKLTILGNR
mgnify:CR=1 FL=1